MATVAVGHGIRILRRCGCSSLIGTSPTTLPKSARLPLRARSARPSVFVVGTIYYGGSDTPIHIEDRALAHLKVVIVTKLRRNETFTLSWQHPDDEPRGRSTIWLHPSIPLRFVFDDPEPTELSREWISDLANSVSSTGGIMLVAEHIDAEPETDASERPGTGDVNLGNVEVDSVDIDKLTVSDVKVTPPSQEERKPLEP
ncbi:hypothetical protein GCM10017607_17690 [Microbacterium thalassium]|nr:hypothetical protein GCM10017607_17690 [Microbacterium thalassium]